MFRIPFLGFWVTCTVTFLCALSLQALGQSEPASPFQKVSPRSTQEASTQPHNVQLYVLDCGHLHFDNLAPFSDTGYYDGWSGDLANPCFLIKHQDNWLLWGTGLGDYLLGQPVRPMTMNQSYTAQASVSVPLLGQLKQLGLVPSDITYVAFAHGRFDQTGNANAFYRSLWLLQKAEYTYIMQDGLPSGVSPHTIMALNKSKKILLDSDYDVFNDGSVRVLRTPGNTPGGQSLFVQLPDFGPVLIVSGLYPLRLSYEMRQIGITHTSRSETLASFDRIEQILKQHPKTHLIIASDAVDIQTLPKSPTAIN